MSCYNYEFSTQTYSYSTRLSYVTYTYCADGTSCYYSSLYSYGTSQVYVNGSCDNGLTGWALALVIIIPTLFLFLVVAACIKRSRQRQLMMNTMNAE